MTILHLPYEILEKYILNQLLLSLLYESFNDIIDIRDNYSFQNYARIMDASLCHALGLLTAWPIANFYYIRHMGFTQDNSNLYFHMHCSDKNYLR
jgi:hypothetical protein